MSQLLKLGGLYISNKMIKVVYMSVTSVRKHGG